MSVLAIEGSACIARYNACPSCVRVVGYVLVRVWYSYRSELECRGVNLLARAGGEVR